MVLREIQKELVVDVKFSLVIVSRLNSFSFFFLLCP